MPISRKYGTGLRSRESRRRGAKGITNVMIRKRSVVWTMREGQGKKEKRMGLWMAERERRGYDGGRKLVIFWKRRDGGVEAKMSDEKERGDGMGLRKRATRGERRGRGVDG